MFRDDANAIFYTPRADEPRLDQFRPQFARVLTVPQLKNTDPVAFVNQARATCGAGEVVVFVPGTAFDTKGNRRGRGGGWYDRFLSLVPTAWQRIGVCFTEQLSDTLLITHPWDQPVDWLYVFDADRFECYETRARQKDGHRIDTNPFV